VSISVIDKLGNQKGLGTPGSVGATGAAGASASQWTAETNFTATPASTSTLTMTADVTTIIKIGFGLRYTIGGTIYYGMVTAITSNLLTIAGAPMGGSVTALAWCNSTRLIKAVYFIPGSFADAADTTLLANDARTKERWDFETAYLVRILHTVRVADTGANQPRATISVNGAVVGTSNTNTGEAVAVTWVSTVVGINTSNYDTLKTETIEIVVDNNGSNKNAQDLTIVGIWVIP
jgi:hypothetical protein